MIRILKLATFAVLLTSAFATTSYAQMSNSCNRQAKALCGKQPIVQCMRRDDLMNAMGQECMGDLQTMIEMDREAREQQAQDEAFERNSRRATQDNTANRRSREQAEQDEAFERNARRESQDDTTTGVSYGGVLRSGPGMNYARVASLQEGDPIDIIKDTGIWFNEYKWYQVRTHRGTGYHWGGIFCVNMDTEIKGIFQKC